MVSLFTDVLKGLYKKHSGKKIKVLSEHWLRKWRFLKMSAAQKAAVRPVGGSCVCSAGP